MSLNKGSQQGAQPPALHHAAVIDRHGREVPITETMIQQACARLDGHWVFPAARSGAAKRTPS